VLRCYYFCFVNGNLKKKDQNDEVLRFAEYWKQKTGHYPEEIVFDSKLSTYKNLDTLNQWRVAFITLRRRTPALLQEAFSSSPSAWRRIELHNIARMYRRPRILDQRIKLENHYHGQIRQIVITDLGHDEPRFLLTNQLTRSPISLVGRYARRMIIENGIADHIRAVSPGGPSASCDSFLVSLCGVRSKN
jgi:hypothetical protein